MASRLARLRRLQPGRQGDPPDSPGPLGSLGGVESAADGRMGGVAGVHGRALSTPGLSRGIVPLVAPFLSAAVLLGAWSLGVAVTCAGFLIAALGASDLTHYVFDARWQQPTGYANTAAALPAMAFWPALMLSARRRTARPLQVLFVVTAVF